VPGDPLSITDLAPRQMIPSSDTSGSETISAPNAGLRLAASDTTAMMTPDKTHLTAK